MKEDENNTANPSWYIYLVGIAIFGLCYESVKSALGGQFLFVGAAIIYLIALRLIGDFVGRIWHERKT